MPVFNGINLPLIYLVLQMELGKGVLFRPFCTVFMETNCSIYCVKVAMAVG